MGAMGRLRRSIFGKEAQTMVTARRHAEQARAMPSVARAFLYPSGRARREKLRDAIFRDGHLMDLLRIGGLTPGEALDALLGYR